MLLNEIHAQIRGSNLGNLDSFVLKRALKVTESIGTEDSTFGLAVGNLY